MSDGKDEAGAAADIGHRRQMRTRREKNGGEGRQREVKQAGQPDQSGGERLMREVPRGGSDGSICLLV